MILFRSADESSVLEVTWGVDGTYLFDLNGQRIDLSSEEAVVLARFLITPCQAPKA